MMKQQTLAMAADSESGYEHYRKPTRRDEFLKAMEAIVPWSALCEVIEPHDPKAGNGPAHPSHWSACCASTSSSTGSIWPTWPARTRCTTAPACAALSELTWAVSRCPTPPPCSSSAACSITTSSVRRCLLRWGGRTASARLQGQHRHHCGRHHHRCAQLHQER